MIAAVSRHWSVLTSAWTLDAEQSRSRQRYAQTEFLPAALEVIETPASPFGRAGLWLLIGGVGVALLWAIIGKLDVVVVAPGKIIPIDQVKVIQPTELGVVRAIHVRDGQQVKAGQLLIELDPTSAGADDAQARTGLMAAQIDSARGKALMSYLNGGRAGFVAPAGVPGELASMQRSVIATQIEEYEARRSVLVRERGEHAAELAGAQAERRKLEETLPLLDKQIEARERLVDKGHFPRLRLYEIEEQRIERVRNMDVQAAAAGKAQAAIGGIDAQLAQLRSELARSTAKDMAEAQDNSDLRTSEITKTDMRNRLMRLTSPVDGTVQQLAIHTLGGVVEPAQALLVVVPADSTLAIEARVSNKDVGFTRVGQPVRVKIDAFPFTDYGTVEGTLENLSSDSIEDEKLGLIYNARVRLTTVAISNGVANIPLTPGMTVSAEIRTGRRRIIQYLLSPIRMRFDEAGRER